MWQMDVANTTGWCVQDVCWALGTASAVHVCSHSPAHTPRPVSTHIQIQGSLTTHPHCQGNARTAVVFLMLGQFSNLPHTLPHSVASVLIIMMWPSPSLSRFAIACMVGTILRLQCTHHQIRRQNNVKSKRTHHLDMNLHSCYTLLYAQLHSLHSSEGWSCVIASETWAR